MVDTNKYNDITQNDKTKAIIKCESVHMHAYPQTQYSS
jgi:hypothetical protein